MRAMSAMEAQGSIVVRHEAKRKCVFDPERPERPCQLCSKRGFACGVQEKIYPPTHQRALCPTETRPLVVSKASNPSQIPDIQVLERVDMNYLQYFVDDTREAELFHAGVAVFPLRRFILPDFPALSLSSKLLSYAMLSIFTERTRAPANDNHSLIYLGKFYASAQEAVRETNFRDLACANYFLGYYALLEAAFEKASAYLLGEFSAIEHLVKMDKGLSNVELHMLECMWARTVGWVSIVYYGSFYPLQVDGWSFTPAFMKQLRREVEAYNSVLRTLLFRGANNHHCPRCHDHYRYYSLRLSLCRFLDELHSPRDDEANSSALQEISKTALREIKAFLSEAYCYPIADAPISGHKQPPCACVFWPDNLKLHYGLYRVDFTDKYHFAYRHCLAAAFFYILSNFTTRAEIIKALDWVRRLFGAITVSPLQRNLLTCPEAFFFAGLRLTWSIGSEKTGTCFMSRNFLTFLENEPTELQVDQVFRIFPSVPWPRDVVRRIWKQAQSNLSLFQLLKLFQVEWNDETRWNPFREEVAFINEILGENGYWPLAR